MSETTSQDQIPINWSTEVPDPTLIEFVKGFQENRKKEIPGVKRLLEARDFEALRRMGHNWKGFSRPYGFIALEAMGKALEEAAKTENFEKCTRIFDQFQEYIKEKESRL